MEERPRNGGPDEGMWTSHYLEGMGYKCIPGSTSRSLGSEYYSDANRSAKNNYYLYDYGAVSIIIKILWYHGIIINYL